MSMAVERWVLGRTNENTKDHIVKALYGPTYWLSISDKKLRKLVEKQYSKIEDGDFVSDPAFHQIQMFLVENRFARHSLFDL
jgi:hypothetical protein